MSTWEDRCVLRVAVEAQDPRVEAAIRQLLASDPGLVVTDGGPGVDVVVVELPPGAGPAAQLRLDEALRRGSVVVLASEDRLRLAVDTRADVIFVDKGRAADDLLSAIRSAAGDCLAGRGFRSGGGR